MSSKRSSSFRRAIANGRRTLQREILLDETGLGLYKRFVRYVAYEILPCETDRRWYFHQNRLCPPPVFIAIVTIVQVSGKHYQLVSECYKVMEVILLIHPQWSGHSWSFWPPAFYLRSTKSASNPLNMTSHCSVSSVVRLRLPEKIFCLWSHTFTVSLIWAGNPFGSRRLSGCI